MFPRCGLILIFILPLASASFSLATMSTGLLSLQFTPRRSIFSIAAPFTRPAVAPLEDYSTCIGAVT